VGHTVTETYSCNLCGRIPGPPTAEAMEMCKGTALFPGDSSNRYGWISLLPQHICTEPLGHNRIDLLREIILCDICWPKVLGTEIARSGTKWPPRSP
jgi:hypothetical protein